MLKRTTGSRLAMSVSFACMIHCIITPMVILFAPLIGGYFDSHVVELALLLLSISIGTFIMCSGYCHHHKKHTLVLFGIGVIFWVIHSICDHLDVFGSIYYLLFGSLFIVCSYYFNHTYLSCCKHNKKC